MKKNYSIGKALNRSEMKGVLGGYVDPGGGGGHKLAEWYIVIVQC